MSPTGWVLAAGWVLLVGSYSIAALTVPNGRGLTAFGDIVQCLAAMFACGGLVLNWGTAEKRTRVFWILLSLGCFAWLALPASLSVAAPNGMTIREMYADIFVAFLVIDPPERSS